MFDSNIMTMENKNKITEIEKDGFVLVRQTDGPDLGYSRGSGVRIIVRDGYAFKSYDGSDTLLPYEDWRLDARTRAADLASRLTIDEIAGLMLYSPQNKLPMPDDTYGGKSFADSGKKAWNLSDSQLKFLTEDNVRHVLVSVVESAETAARWNNQVQALVEGRTHGIPANNSSDPRHSAFKDAEFSPGASGQLSLWSNLIGLAATFDPETAYEFGRIAAAEYRAMGIATALSPQADLGTDPRWYRYNATFGNDPKLAADLVRAYCDGFQSSPGSDSGDWGPGSVNAMVKHWPGGGTGEGGRDAHYGNGKYAVYPGGCFETHKLPFRQGAFALKGKTGKASAVMPYYTISYDRTSENVGNSYNREIIDTQLRGEEGYDGVICTDWAITWDQIAPGVHSGKPWGVETLTPAERHYKALMAGVDQFGGNNDKVPVIEAYRMGVKEHGEKVMRERMERSAARLLVNMFRPGLFENPYVDVEITKAAVGQEAWMQKGYDQQLRSIVMLKNSGATLPARKGAKVYVPRRRKPEMINYWGGKEAESVYDPVTPQIAARYYEAVGPDEADFAIVFIDSPHSKGMCYDREEAAAGGTGYVPISLQYRPYTAVNARPESIATDPAEPIADRNYRDKTAGCWNECDLDLVEETRRLMGGRPVVVVIDMCNPTVMGEFEPLADAIFVGFNVQTQAFLDLIFGEREPSGLLPFEMPASMDAIEEHCEDKPHDIRPYVDSDGNVYEFGYGLGYHGRIADERTERYKA